MESTRAWLFATVLVAPLIGGGALAGDTVERPAPIVETGEPRAVPPVIHRTGDPADTLYQTARAALSRGDYNEAARLFGRIVEQEPGSEYAPDALYWRAFALYRVGGTDALGLALEALDLQAERFPDAATLGDARALRTRIMGELASRGDAEAAERVVSAAGGGASGGVGVSRGVTVSPSPRAGDCPDEESEMRIAALQALMRMDAERALPILERVLEQRDECAVELRERAVFVIAEGGSDRAQDILLNVARTDPSPAVRAKAVFWLSEVDDPRAVDALEDILTRSDDQELREKALFALSQHESERAGAILRRHAEDAAQSAELRAKAIFWLAEHDAAENVAFLKGLFRRLEEPQLQERVLFAVAQSDDPGAGAWLVEVARDASLPAEIRGKALFWAAESGDEGAFPLLLAMWDQVRDPEIRRQLLFAYSQMDTPAAFDKLIEIARSDAEVEVRKRALMWLGESDDPRVAEILEEMIIQ